MSATSERDAVKVLVRRDPEKALAMASQIVDPWFRCQALAFVARTIKDLKKRNKVLKEAFGSASDLTEPNRIVTVSAWPLRVLSDYREEAWVEREIERLLQVISQESHPTRRGDGLVGLIHALHRGPKPTLMKVVEQFKVTCQQGHGWKRDQNLYEVAILIKKHDPAKSKELLDLIEDAGKKRNVPNKFDKENDEQYGARIDLRFS